MVGTSNESVPVAWPLKFYHCICWRALAQALRAVQPSFRRIGRWNQQKNMENSWRPNLKLQWIFYDILTSEKRNAWECTHTKHLSDLSKKSVGQFFGMFGIHTSGDCHNWQQSLQGFELRILHRPFFVLVENHGWFSAISHSFIEWPFQVPKLELLNIIFVCITLNHYYQSIFGGHIPLHSIAIDSSRCFPRRYQGIVALFVAERHHDLAWCWWGQGNPPGVGDDLLKLTWEKWEIQQFFIIVPVAKVGNPPFVDAFLSEKWEICEYF